MDDPDPKPNNPLGPYFPSEVPDVPANGRQWVAILVAFLFLLWLLAKVLRVIGLMT